MATTLGTKTGAAKLQAVTELVDKLTNDLEHVSLLPKDRNEALEELKIYGRDPTNSDPIFTPDGIKTLLKHAFESPSRETSRAALRVLANAMVLKPTTRQMFVDEGFVPKACAELKTQSWDDEFLISRLLFLSTYGTTVELSNLIAQHKLATSILDNLAKHAKRISNKATSATEPMEDMALAETLKLLFNIMHFCKDEAPLFNTGLTHILALLWRNDIPSKKPMEPPFGALVNALVNFDFSDDKAKAILYPTSEPTKVSSRLIALLDGALTDYQGSELDNIVTPLVSVISKLYEHAPTNVQETMQMSLLPTVEDRAAVLGKTSTLSSKLLKNSTNPLTPALRNAISHLQFDLSGRDASKFVENVGYGFASGFLFSNNIPIPNSASEAFSAADASGNSKDVNPITGQFLDKEKHPDVPEMTQEEKEREAEKLFVLFERLKKNGIIDVQNPVEQAFREGKFRELDDDEVEELD